MSQAVKAGDLVGVTVPGDLVEALFSAAGGLPPPSGADELGYYLNSPERGFSLLVRGDRVDTVFLYSANDGQGFHEYAGELPEALTFTTSRDEVRARLGPPFRS